jgi:hypothetical protein
VSSDVVRGDLRWPVHWPGLSLCDYLLNGYIKSRLFIYKPRAIAELKQSIKEEF